MDKDKLKFSKEKAANDAKNASNLKKYLSQALQQFEKNKEWADYGQWLQKVAKYLEEYPSYQIPEKLLFAKRLAQCLNPSLPPIIHTNTIQVYSLLFRNMEMHGYNWCADLGIYSIGLFPLFQYASFQVKPKILELFRDHYFRLGKQLIPCISGLVVSILPGIDEQNEALQKNVYETLDKLMECVGKKYFIGAIWMAILRNPRVRSAGIKYLSKRLKRTYIDNEENEDANVVDDDEDEIASESDHNTIPMVNQVEPSMDRIPQGTSPEMRKGSLNLLDKLDDPRAQYADTEIVTETPQGEERYLNYALSQDEEAFLKSLDDPNEKEIDIEYPNKSSLVINALLASLEDDNLLVQKATLDFMHSHFKLQTEIFNENEKIILVMASLRLLFKKDQQVQRRVYTWLLGPPDMENKYQISEKNRSALELIIRSFCKLFSKEPISPHSAALPLKVLQNFYMEHDHLVEMTLKDVSVSFLSYIQKHSAPNTPFSEDVQKAGARFMENIISYFSLLLTSLSQTLDNQISTNNNDECLKIINLIEFTFKLESSLSTKEENLNYLEQKSYLKSIISGILRSTSTISPERNDILPFIITALNLNLSLIEKIEALDLKLNQFFKDRKLTEEQIRPYVEPTDIDYSFVKTLDLFSTFFQKVVSLILNYKTENEIPQRVMDLFSAASETIVKSQIFQINLKFDILPEWIQSVITCIKSRLPSVSIIGIRTIQAIILRNSTSKVFEHFKNLIKIEATRPKGQDFVRLTIERLWALLDIHYIQNEVSDLLVSFQAQFPILFSDTVTNSFHVASITEKETAIRRFAAFWKLSNDQQTSRFIDSGVGLFIMLDFLDNDNPLLRHTSKSWLSDSISTLYRVIDPIFEVLMQTAGSTVMGEPNYLKLYVTDTKQYFFTEVYDTKQVQNAFRKLKSILITANELFIHYILKVNISERLKRVTKFFSTNGVNNVASTKYLDLLVVLCLKYIQGHAVECLLPQFQIDNASVNASACEFLELLINRVDAPDTSGKMTHFVMEPLLIVLNHAIANKDYVLQVQLINLLTVILFRSKYCTFEGTRYNCVSLLGSKRFVPYLLQGLTVDQPYVRVQFIKFISLCIGVLSQNLQKGNLNEKITLILKAYFDIILNKHLEVAEDNEEFEPWDADNVNFDSDDVSTKRIEIDNAQGKSKENRRVMKNTFTIRYQTQYDIFILLEGVKNILNFFLKLDSKKEVQHHAEEGPGVLDMMKDLITFQFLRGTDEKKEVQIDPQSETVRSILTDMFKIVFILIYSWRLSKEFRQWVDFTGYGITPYSFEKYNEINKTVSNLHVKIDPNAKNVKSLIISVLKPLMENYTNETVNSFLSYWIMECEKTPEMKTNPRMMKQIEIMVTMDISGEKLLTALSKNQLIIDLSEYYLKKTQSSKKQQYALKYDAALTESRIFFFVYTYLSFCHIEIGNLNKEYLNRLWMSFLNFTKLFQSSRAPCTHLWILELMFLLSQKYNPKEILSDTKMRKELHSQLNNTLMTIANHCGKISAISYGDPNDKKFKTVLPLPPTIYELYKNYKLTRKDPIISGYKSLDLTSQDLDSCLENLMLDEYIFDKFEHDDKETHIADRYRLFSFKTLKRVALNLVQNTYSPDKVERIIKRMKEFMEVIFPVIEDKSKENQPFVEVASELLYSQLDSSRSLLIKDYKKYILEIFNGNDFFKCTKQTLKYWSKIIDWIVTMEKEDLLTEHLSRVSAFSIFFSKDTETRAKIKHFERICFIVYSGERDKYHEKLFNLLEKMGEVIKSENAHPSLLILILFCVRILILRLTPSTLNDLFRQIWPILLTLLIQIFNKRNTQKNPNLILAALKLIELMAIVQLEEFYINQWVFMFDYFGLTLESTNQPMTIQTNDMSQTSETNETRNKVSGFVFQPYCTNAVQDQLRINYKPNQLDNQKDLEKNERRIVMTMTKKVDDELEIKVKALFLCQYVIQHNDFRTQVDSQQIESLIEGDFISLDDYIFKIN